MSGAVPQQPAFAAVKAREEAEEQREVLSKKKKIGSRKGNGDVDTRHDDGEKLESPMFPPLRRADTQDTQVPISGRGSQGCAAGDYRGGVTRAAPSR